MIDCIMECIDQIAIIIFILSHLDGGKSLQDIYLISVYLAEGMPRLPRYCIGAHSLDGN